MYDAQPEQVAIDLEQWVESTKSNPVLYKQRQATEVVLTAIGLSTVLSGSLVLKGGTLMAIAFKSDRATGDVDFTSTAPPEAFAEEIKQELNASIPLALKKLGYTDLLCKVQKVKKKPRPQNFLNLDFPALDITVGYAERNSPQEKRFKQGASVDVILLEISFRDQVYHFQELHLFDSHVALKAFTENEIFSEKLRALIQQKAEHRNRHRRQDIYDLKYLLDHRSDKLEPERILCIFREKCATRGITPSRASLADKEIYERSKKQWKTNELEIGTLPDFDASYVAVQTFYEQLPWDEA